MRPDGPRDPVAGPDSGPAPPFPLKLDGKVIKGFGRGSSDLGIPTANIPISGLSVGGREEVESGVYFGWVGLSSSLATQRDSEDALSKYKLISSEVYSDLMTKFPHSGENGHGSEDTSPSKSREGKVYPMVMSIGWNPYYKNTVRSVEVHVMHHFEKEFYDSHMNLMILGFIRPEYDYVSKDSLIEDIRTDIDVAGRSLSREVYAKFAKDSYLLSFASKSDVAS